MKYTCTVYVYVRCPAGSRNVHSKKEVLSSCVTESVNYVYVHDPAGSENVHSKNRTEVLIYVRHHYYNTGFLSSVHMLKNSPH